jgi:hypothetical protein
MYAQIYQLYYVLKRIWEIGLIKNICLRNTHLHFSIAPKLRDINS